VPSPLIGYASPVGGCKALVGRYEAERVKPWQWATSNGGMSASPTSCSSRDESAPGRVESISIVCAHGVLRLAYQAAADRYLESGQLLEPESVGNSSNNRALRAYLWCQPGEHNKLACI
jgi:hypothetical protein